MVRLLFPVSKDWHRYTHGTHFLDIVNLLQSFMEIDLSKRQTSPGQTKQADLDL